MRRYPAYQDSGVDWLGEIPTHWQVIRIKWLSPVKRGASPRPIADPKYFDNNGRFAWVRIADVTASERYLQSTKDRLSELGSSLSVKQYPGNLFISIAGSVGKPIITKIDCCIHDGFVYFPELKINPEFLFYIFKAGELFRGLGKLGTQLNLNTNTIGSIKVPLPLDNEIEAIINYLDEKTAVIDKYLSHKQRLIQLLQEQKQAIINTAVTQGLDPTTPRKPSSLDWLDDIPSHWSIKKLKFLVPEITVGIVVTPAKYYVEKGIPCLRSLNISKGYIDSTDLVYISNESNELHSKSKIYAGDLVIIRTGRAGTAVVIPTDFHNANCIDLLIVRKSNLVLSNYLNYFINSSITKTQVDLYSVGAIQLHFNTSTLANLLVICPSKHEQAQIVKYIQQKTAEIDTAIQHTQQEIALIQEYRTSLIAQAVTGKIDVRPYAQPPTNP